MFAFEHLIAVAVELVFYNRAVRHRLYVFNRAFAAHLRLVVEFVWLPAIVGRDSRNLRLLLHRVLCGLQNLIPRIYIFKCRRENRNAAHASRDVVLEKDYVLRFHSLRVGINRIEAALVNAICGRVWPLQIQSRKIDFAAL